MSLQSQAEGYAAHSSPVQAPSRRRCELYRTTLTEATLASWEWKEVHHWQGQSEEFSTLLQLSRSQNLLSSILIKTINSWTNCFNKFKISCLCHPVIMQNKTLQIVHFVSQTLNKVLQISYYTYTIHSMHLIICQGTVEKGYKCSRRQSEEYETHVFYSSMKPPNFRLVRIVYKSKNKELDSVNVLCFLQVQTRGLRYHKVSCFLGSPIPYNQSNESTAILNKKYCSPL